MPAQNLPEWQKIPQLSRLLDLPQRPKQLFYEGSWEPQIFASCAAVVGSRRMTSYGRQAVEMLVPRLVQAQKTIVSGFMYGVDQYAHRLAIENGGKTIAVLGWGINQTMEVGDEKLADDIVQSGGLLLSEWEKQKPTLWTFPVRNRIVAALCSDVYVIEAAEKSGSLITASYAFRLKRNLWAVPGPVTSRLSKGTNLLISRGIAKMWTGELPENRRVTEGNPITKLLQDEPLTANDLARRLGLPIEEVGSQLSLLTVTGEVSENDGKFSITYVH